MHRKFRKLASMALAAIMCVGLSVPAFAAEGDPDAPASRITYDIFQIFTGQYADGGSGSQGAGDMAGETLSNVKWGVNGTGTTGEFVDDAILAELDALVNRDENGNATDQGAQDFENISRLDVILKYVDLESEPLHGAVTSIDEVKKLTLDNGYYLVRVTPGSVADGEAYPTYTVQVLDNHIENFKPKGLEGGVPTIDKKADGNQKNNAAIGDVVTFTITSTLPTNMHDYKEYAWVLRDTMSEGLTWAPDKRVEAGKAAGVVSATIRWSDDNITGDVLDFMYVGDRDENGEIVMGFSNLKSLYINMASGGQVLDMPARAMTFPLAKDGAVIEIVYQAVVNEKAEIASDGNSNEVVLAYSNDPNHSGDGTTGNDPDQPPVPGPGNNTGNTVEGEHTKTETWVTGLTVEHFNSKGTPLSGSEFTLTGTDIKTTIKYTSNFRAPQDGETANYYKLTNGSYTSVAPITEGENKNDSLYESLTPEYIREDVLVTVNETPTEVTAAIDDNGNLTITGLKAGTYKLQNTKIPNGYNLADDIDFTISFDETNLFSSNNDQVQERTAEWFYVTIIAGNGTLLPETGGMGVYVLYGMGIVLIAAAGAFLFMKNKKKADAE